jgi:uncharacterized membrane protein
MNPNRSLLVSAAFIVIAAIAAVWLWPSLPAQVPSHWDFHGRVNDHMPRLWAALMPILGVALFAFLTWLLPVISPNRFRIGPFAHVYTGLMLAFQGFMLVVGLGVLLAGAGYALPIPTVAMLAIGALFTILGNYMGKLQRNFFIGIRTPWTIASEATWERTHRLGGKLFVLAGVVVLAGTLFGLPFPVSLAVLIAAGLVPAVYSFFIYRRIEGPPQD